MGWRGSASVGISMSQRYGGEVRNVARCSVIVLGRAWENKDANEAV